MTQTRNRTFLRYWGSHFKSLRQASLMAAEFRPLRAEGWNCHLVLERLPNEERWLEELKAMEVGIHLMRRPGRKLDLPLAMDIRRMCRRLQVTVFACDNIHLTPLLGARLAGVRSRFWFKRAMNAHFEQCREPGWKERLSPSTRLSAGLATRIVAVSGAVKRELCTLGVPESKVIIRLNPKRLGTVTRSTRAAMRAALGYAPDEIVFVCVAHAVPVKGWDLLVKAFADISFQYPHARLLLVGSTERAEERSLTALLTRQLETLDLKHRVRFTGHVENVADHLLASDIFVMPSRSEGFSNALIEAMEAGLPCIATRVGIAEDVIQHGRNGLLVERNSSAAIAAQMGALLAAPRMRDALAKNLCSPENVPSIPQYAAQLASDYNTYA